MVERKKWGQINKIKNEKEVTMDTTEMQKIIRDYYKQLHVSKPENIEELNKLLEKHKLPRQNW